MKHESVLSETGCKPLWRTGNTFGKNEISSENYELIRLPMFRFRPKAAEGEKVAGRVHACAQFMGRECDESNGPVV